MKVVTRVDDAAAMDASFNGAPLNVEHFDGLSVVSSWTNDTPGNDTFVSGAYEVQTLTYAALADTTDGDFVIIEDAAGIKYALAADTTGLGAVTPAGPLWTAADYKAIIDISGATDAASVAALMEIGWNALTGFTAAITSDDSAADGTMTQTQTAFGPVTNPVPKNAAESAAGSIAGVQTTAGVASSLDLGDDTINLGAHGMYTGLKVQLTTTGTLPTGVTPATDYFVIVTDDDKIQLAASLVDANAGTEINLSAEGSGAHTAVVQDTITGTLKLQISNNAFNGNVNNNPDANAVWVDYTSSSQAVSGAGSVAWNVADVYFKAVRVVWTRTAGTGTISTILHAKGPN